MSAAKKEKSAPADVAPAQRVASKVVDVTNTRAQPLCIKVARCHTIRVGPCETVRSVPEHLTRTPELQALRRRGFVTVGKARNAPRPKAAEAPSEQPGKGAVKKGSKGK